MLSYIMNVLMLTKCYEDYGCFGVDGNFQSVHRPINLMPLSPEEIGTQFYLYTRTNGWTIPENLNYRNKTFLNQSSIHPNRDFKIIVHGYREYGNKVWVQHMVRELLKKDDFNVIVADWKNGSYYAYPQAVANARLVGVIIAKFVESLINVYNTSAKSFHLIGHSLGAHVVGYAGKKLNKLGRISALDPAKPYFEDTPPEVRLDPSDAEFVDVIHTDVAPMYSGGMGMYQACGHVDFYPNGGELQPGCSERITDAIEQHGGSFSNGVKDFVVCKHIRSHRLFIESINTNCPLLGVACNSWAKYNQGDCFDCSSASQCAQMGYNADKFKPYISAHSPVKMYLMTGDSSPYCRYHYKLTISTPSYKNPNPGKLFVTLVGANGESKEELYLNREISFEPESTYAFIIASSNLGNLSSVVAVWKHSNKIWDPYTWHLMSQPILDISFIRVDNIETSNSWVTCSIHKHELRSKVPETIPVSEYCNYDLSQLMDWPGPVPASLVPAVKEACYDDIGCFNIKYPFFDPEHGRFLSVVPQSPKRIRIRYILYTRYNPIKPQYIVKYDLASVKKSNFNPKRDTKIITHGFLDNGFAFWLKEMTEGLLKKYDCNVIVVDWSGGNLPPYVQATANTRVVGAEIASLWIWMEDFCNATRDKLHLLGHSLGAHVAGYAGERMKGVPHITGLDPAGPYFEFTQPEVRLDPTDAKFVESIHTNGNGISGFGMLSPISHFDYYPNGGKVQAGCERLHLEGIWKDGIDEGMRNVMSCSHQRACDLYVDSLSEQSCPYLAHQCDSWERFKAGNCTSCGEDGSLCATEGYNSITDYPINISSSIHRKFYYSTATSDPYCYYHFYVRIELDADSKLDNIFAALYIKVCGESSFCTDKLELTQGGIKINAGQVLEFVFAQPTNISPAQRVDFQWDSKKLLRPLIPTYIILKTFEITPMDERPESTRLSHQRCLSSAIQDEKIKPGRKTTLIANGTC